MELKFSEKDIAKIKKINPDAIIYNWKYQDTEILDPDEIMHMTEYTEKIILDYDLSKKGNVDVEEMKKYLLENTNVAKLLNQKSPTSFKILCENYKDTRKMLLLYNTFKLKSDLTKKDLTPVQQMNHCTRMWQEHLKVKK